MLGFQTNEASSIGELLFLGQKLHLTVFRKARTTYEI